MSLQKDIILNDRYALVQLLGKGSFGEVWLANDLQLGIEVAVKVYVALDGNGRKEFGREYLRMRSLSHTNLLRADHYALYGDRPFLVMEYCPSGAKELIGNADELTLLRFIRDVASGLAYMHEHDMLHRDIKPDNILQKTDGTFVITDFGLSKNMHSTLLRNSSRNLSTDSVNDMFSGTVEYMAPELFTPDPLAVKATDVWALGVTLYEIIMGELPFFGQGGNMMNFGAAVPNIHAPLSESLKDTIRACMKKDPWDRPTAQTLAEWAQDALNSFYAPRYSSPKISYPEPSESLSDESTVLPEPPVENPGDPLEWELPTEEHKRRVWPLLAASVLLLLGLAGFLVWKFAMPQGPNPSVKLFAECRTKNDIGLYRYYVEQYPEGDSVDAAKAWIKDWEQDSIANLILAEPTDDQLITDNSTTLEKKTEKEKSKAEKEKEKKKEEEKKKEKATGFAEAEGNGPKLKPESEPDPNSTLPHPGLADRTPSGLSPDSKSPNSDEKLSPKSEMTEEEMAGKATTINDCCDYVAKYGNSGKYISDVRAKFRQLYARKFAQCKTLVDYQRFLKDHDGIMKKMRLGGSQDDKAWRNRAENKIKELQSNSAHNRPTPDDKPIKLSNY